MIEKQSENVINEIEKYKEDVFLNPRLIDGLKKYIFLKKRFEDGQISDDEFKTSFKNFYGLNNAGLTPTFKSRYFELLSESSKETELCGIIKSLYEIPNYKGIKTIQFSFATKLLHMFDNSRPIYDSKVASVLTLDNPYGLKGNSKILWCDDTYKKLRYKYVELLNNKRVKNIISEMRCRFSDSRDISDTKAIDFILWLMPKKKKKMIKA